MNGGTIDVNQIYEKKDEIKRSIKEKKSSKESDRKDKR